MKSGKHTRGGNLESLVCSTYRIQVTVGCVLTIESTTKVGPLMSAVPGCDLSRVLAKPTEYHGAGKQGRMVSWQVQNHMLAL